RRLDGPRYVDGYLPIVRIGYTEGKTRYEQEAFAPVRGALAERGAVLVRFTVRGDAGVVVARGAFEGEMKATEGRVRAPQGPAPVLSGAGGSGDGKRKDLRSTLAADASADLAVLPQPLPPPLPALTHDRYDEERATCGKEWRSLLAWGTRLEIPEPVVQDAWRALIVGNYLIASGDRMNYSAGNAYDHLYEAEC